MKVEWSKRAKLQHQSLRKVERVKARLKGEIIGDITLGVPVITEDMMRRLGELYEAFAAIEDRLEDLTEELHASLNYVRGENDVEGWADVLVVERTKDLLVADIRHHKHAPPEKKPPKGHSVVTRHMNTWGQPPAHRRPARRRRR